MGLHQEADQRVRVPSLMVLELRELLGRVQEPLGRQGRLLGLLGEQVAGQTG